MLLPIYKVSMPTKPLTICFALSCLRITKNSEDKGEFVSLEEAAKMCGVKIKIDSVLSVLNNMMQKYIFTVIKQFLNFQFSVFI